LIQNLFELKRTRDIVPFLENFYGSIASTPFELTYMTYFHRFYYPYLIFLTNFFSFSRLNARVSVGELNEAETIIRDFDHRLRNQKKPDDTKKPPLSDATDAIVNSQKVVNTPRRSSPKPITLTTPQYEDLVQHYHI